MLDGSTCVVGMITIFVGLDNAGKTSIKTYLETLSIDAAMNTRMSTQVETYLRGGFRVYIFPGQRKLRYDEFLYERFFPLADKIALIVDAADKRRFGEVRKYWQFLYRMIDKYGRKKVQVILVAHKQDLPNALRWKEILPKIFDVPFDVGLFDIRCANTSIFDPPSMSMLLRTLHGATSLGIETLLSNLRRLTKSEVAMLFDTHLHPIAMSGTTTGSEIFRRVHALVVDLEKHGFEAFVGVFRDYHVFVMCRGGGEGRVIVALVNFGVKVNTAAEFCDETLKQYARMRDKIWA